MSEPASSIGCIFGCLAVIAGLFLYLLIAAVSYGAIPLLGLVLAFRIWGLDRTSAVGVLVPSALASPLAINFAYDGFSSQTPSEALGHLLATSYTLIITIEIAIFFRRKESKRPAYQETGRLSLKMGLISLAAGLTIAYLTDFWPF